MTPIDRPDRDQYHWPTGHAEAFSWVPGSGVVPLALTPDSPDPQQVHPS